MELPIWQVLICAFLISVILCPIFIKVSHQLRFKQHIRTVGPVGHLTKTGTPTMGGIVFVVAGILPAVIIGNELAAIFYLCLFVTLANAFIGGIDDYGKVKRSASLGLKARSKIIGQLGIVVVLTIFLINIDHPTSMEIPFTDVAFDLGVFYPLFLFLMIAGTTNAVNLTDGIDGLAGGLSIIALSTFLVLALLKGMPEVALFCGGLIGACLGFLVFNLHPAKLFMGDVGSLALGAALAIAAVFTKSELLLVIIGAVFVVETLSVIVQVLVYRFAGKRFLLMSPLHHHFELKGWSEWKIVTVFWGISLILAVVSLWETGII